MRDLTLATCLLSTVFALSSYGEVPPERKFGVAALLASSPDSVVSKVRAGSEDPVIPIPPREPDPLPSRIARVPALSRSPLVRAKPVTEIRKPDPIEARKREIQLLEFRLAQQQTLLALQNPPVAPVAGAAPPSRGAESPTAASRLLLAVRGAVPASPLRSEGLPSFSPEPESPTNPARDLQVVLAYHLSPRGSSKERAQRVPTLRELRRSTSPARPSEAPALAIDGRNPAFSDPNAAAPKLSAVDRELNSLRVFGDKYESDAPGKTAVRVFDDGEGAVAGSTAKNLRVFGDHAAGSSSDE